VTDETMAGGPLETDAASKDSNRADARTRRARAAFGAIMIILLLLLCGATLLFLRAIAPLGGPDKKVASDGLVWVRSIYGYGKADADQLKSPNDTAIDTNGTIWVADTSHARIVGFAPDGSYRALVHRGPAFSNPQALQTPTGVAVDRNHNVWVADYGRNVVGVYSPRNQLVREIPIELPVSVAVRDGRVVVGSYYGVAILTEQGDLIKAIGAHGKGPDEFDIVYGVAIDRDGNIYVTDQHNNRLRAFDRNGKVLWTNQMGEPTNTGINPTGKFKTTKLSTELPSGLTIDGAGRLVFVDPFEFDIVVADRKTGKVLAKYGQAGTVDGKFAYPTGIDYDPARDWFAVADTSNNRVQIVRIPGSGGNLLDALQRAMTNWWKICGIPLLLILVAAITTAIMRRRRNRQEGSVTDDQNESGSDEEPVDIA
jgi:sugar lactone lactonase YvrE